MKKIHVLLSFTVFILFQTMAFAVDKEFVGKIGTSYAKDSEKFGLDISLNYIYALDPYFAGGIEADFFWMQWDRNMGKKEIGQTNAVVKAKTNAYNIPFLFNAIVRFPNLARIIYVEPSLIVGMGYAVMILDDSIPEYTDATGTHNSKNDINLYSGFVWQALASISFRPAPESNINFTFDFGYRGLYPEKSGIEFNMSGLLFRAGVKFKL